ncbi:MAG: DUF559 domain-containing protein, partial [Acidimicrobiia bacterium]
SKPWALAGLTSRIIELTVPYTKGPLPAGVVIHRTRRRLPYVVLDGMPTATVERTLLDLAAMVPPIVLEKLTTSALHQQHTTIDKLVVSASIHGGRGVKGTRRMRAVMALLDGDVTGSPAEVDMMELLRSAPIPMPVCQFETQFPEGDHGFPDFAWPDLHKCVEVDGFDSHGTPEALDRDLIRQNRLLELGWEMRRFSARRIRTDPAGVVDDLIRFVGGRTIVL